MSSHNPFDVLGIPTSSSASEIRQAWKKKASSLHPDAGGSHEAMIRLNNALDEALATAVSTDNTIRHQVADKRVKRSRGFVARDTSCFTIDALPVDSWPLLYMGATQCGPIIDEEEPYLLEFMLSDSSIDDLRSAMCRCEIVPEAGASTVHVAVFSETGKIVDVEIVRDLLVSTINELSN